MKTFTIADIRGWNPCYDPGTLLPENWSGTALDILRLDTVPCADRLWVVLHSYALDEKTLRLFAVWCCRQVQPLMTDSRSIAAIAVAERFANGEATDAELAAAWEAAWAAWQFAKSSVEMAAAWLPCTVCTAMALSAAARTASAAEIIGTHGAASKAQVAQLIKMLKEQV